MDIPLRLLPHTVTVETRVGPGSRGITYAEPVQVRAMVVEQDRKVLGADGEERVSSTQFGARLAHQDTCPVGSRVTLPTGRVTHVIGLQVADDGGLGAWQHIQVACE